MHTPPLQTQAAKPQPADGGPAFPVERQTAHSIAVHTVGTQDEAAYIAEVGRLSQGMSLRDYFAGIALAGLIHHEGAARNDDMRLADARRSYAMADAMLAARKEAA